MPSPLSDLALTRRLERAEGNANRSFVEARARLHPDSGATWQDVDGTYAMFDGVGSPITQSFGLGAFAPATPGHLDALEHFFESRGADVMHETSPVALVEDGELLMRLHDRGYRPHELSTVLCRTIGDVPDAPNGRASRATVRRLDVQDAELWAETSAQGWRELEGVGDFMRGFALISAHAEGMHCFVAEIDGSAIAAGGMSVHGGVAILAGASTIPEHRAQGAQGALLQARLRHATRLGCDLALMAALPGSASQRNAQRQGFDIAYTRIKWGK